MSAYLKKVKMFESGDHIGVRSKTKILDRVNCLVVLSQPHSRRYGGLASAPLTFLFFY
jgi:hypothetical protein